MIPTRFDLRQIHLDFTITTRNRFAIIALNLIGFEQPHLSGPI